MGGALPAWMSSIGDFLKKNKVISRAGSALGSMLPGPWGTAAGLVGKAANAVGYGRRRRARRALKTGGAAYKCGGALTLAGGALY